MQRKILLAGDQLLALVSAVPELSRIQAGKLPVSLEPVDLAVLDALLPPTPPATGTR